MFEDDDEFEQADRIRQQLAEKTKKEFIEGCYEAFDILMNDGPKALEEAEASSIQRAINRMTSFFIMKEEYEKCQFLQSYVSKYMPGFVITPDESIQRDLIL